MNSSKRIQRAQRKAELEASIDQQRLSLINAASHCNDASRRLDRYWHTLKPYRTALLAAGGIALIPVLRRPGTFTRIIGKTLTTAIAVQRLRRLLS